MKKFIGALALTFTLLATQAAQAQLKDGLGLGIVLGEPTGLSLKVRTSGDQAISAAAAWSFTDNPSFQFHLDYLFHNFEILSSPGQKGQFPLYYGFGGRVKLKDNSENAHKDNETLAGIRLPLGISYLFENARVDLFAEIAPILDVVPKTEFGWGAGFGARFYF